MITHSKDEAKGSLAFIVDQRRLGNLFANEADVNLEDLVMIWLRIWYTASAGILDG